jgi:YVTN family beta-propeller protein
MQTMQFARLSAAVLLVGLVSCASSRARSASGTLIVLNKSDGTASAFDASSHAARFTSKTGVGPHEVAVSPDGKLAVVADYGEQQAGSSLTVLDVASGALVRTIELGEPSRPHGIVFEDARRVIVTSEVRHALLRVDVGDGRVLDVLPTEQEVSHMVVLTPDGKRAFVANIGSGSVTAIDLASGKVVKQIATGQGSEGIAITSSRRCRAPSSRSASRSRPTASTRWCPAPSLAMSPCSTSPSASSCAASRWRSTPWRTRRIACCNSATARFRSAS